MHRPWTRRQTRQGNQIRRLLLFLHSSHHYLDLGVTSKRSRRRISATQTRTRWDPWHLLEPLYNRRTERRSWSSTYRPRRLAAGGCP